MAKSKKKSKSVIPKRIAGVKVPKKARKGRFGELLASRTGQAMIARAILVAGEAAPSQPIEPEAERWTPDYGAPEARTRP